MAMEHESPHVVYNDLKYRRVCTDVYHSTLCMILRFPFEVPLQDALVTIPSPVDDQFYQLPKQPIFIDGHLLEVCRLESSTLDLLGDRIRTCLENEASHHPDHVVAIFTRHSHRHHYGITSDVQQRHLFEFFHNHDILVVGDSLSPRVTMALTDLFRTCSTPDEWANRQKGTHGLRSYICQPPLMPLASPASLAEPSILTALQRHLRSPSESSSYNDSDSILLTNMWYVPEAQHIGCTGCYKHVVNQTLPFLDEIKSKQFLLRPQRGDPHQTKH